MQRWEWFTPRKLKDLDSKYEQLSVLLNNLMSLSKELEKEAKMAKNNSERIKKTLEDIKDIPQVSNVPHEVRAQAKGFIAKHLFIRSKNKADELKTEVIDEYYEINKVEETVQKINSLSQDLLNHLSENKNLKEDLDKLE